MLEAALGQRIRALEAFVADIYSAQRIVRDGVVPAKAVAGAAHFEPLMQQAVHDQRRFITVAGFDCVHEPDGTVRVLADDVRTPPDLPAVEALGEALRAAAPAGVDEPTVVVLGDRGLAAALDLPAVRLADLRLRGGRLMAQLGDGELPVDVVHRRTGGNRLSHDRGGLTDAARLLFEPWCAGRLGLVNAFGTGVADDRLLHAHVETMVRFYLGEEPLVASVRTWDLSTPRAMNAALERLDELVVKPRARPGRIVLGPLATTAERAAVQHALRSAPADFVVQDFVPGAEALRAFVLCGAGDPVAVVRTPVP